MIGSVLLKNVTISIHKVDVVCVQDIKDYSLFEFLFHEDNLEYDCCIGEKISGEIRCNQSARNTPWLEAFNVVLIMLQGVLVLFFPAFPLVLPDFIFNFEQEPEELEKEIQLEENLNSNRRSDDADNQGQELQGRYYRYYYRRDSTAKPLFRT